MASFFTGEPHMYWWVQIQTTVPVCKYYFGPFASMEEAEAHQSGYVEDLVRENALEIVVTITRCQPEFLTLCDDECDVPPRMNNLRNLSPYDYPTVLSHC